MKYVVGEKLWFVERSRRGEARPGRYVTVVRVGRTLAEVNAFNYENSVVDMQSGTVYRDRSRDHTAGSLYESETAHAEMMALRKAWAEFRVVMSNRYTAPEGVTEADIERASEILKLGSSVCSA